MVRPAFLLAEVEPEDGISTRKLVLETAKFNVITAHSLKEMLELLQLHPKVDAVILHSSLAGFDCEDIVAAIRKRQRDTPILVLSPSSSFRCRDADHHLTSHEPEELLDLLRSMFGDPRAKPAA
ncbi:MAG TPA: response regulator [Candidatus Angelobacter sp.]